jgi:hypothetical protein
MSFALSFAGETMDSILASYYQVSSSIWTWLECQAMLSIALGTTLRISAQIDGYVYHRAWLRDSELVYAMSEPSDHEMPTATATASDSVQTSSDAAASAGRSAMNDDTEA